jgi:hypothetical protein
MKTFKHKLLLPVLMMTGFLYTSCEEMWDRCVDGNGDRRIENRTLQSFSRVEVNGDFEVQIDTGYGPSASIEADENLMDLIVTHVSGNKLIIETRNGACIKPSNPIEITIGTETLEEISLNGSGFVYCYGLNTEDLSLNLAGSGQIDCNNAVALSADIQLEGSGSIKCDVVSENLTTKLEGSGEIRLSGDCLSADHTIIGSGKIKAGQVTSNVCVVYISGSGITETHVNTSLDVTIIGSGIVYYTGNPTLSTFISGSGKVIER